MNSPWTVQFLVNMPANPGTDATSQSRSSQGGFASLEEAKSHAEGVVARSKNIAGVQIYGPLGPGGYAGYQLIGIDPQGQCVWRQVS